MQLKIGGKTVRIDERVSLNLDLEEIYPNPRTSRLFVVNLEPVTSVTLEGKGFLIRPLKGSLFAYGPSGPMVHVDAAQIAIFEKGKLSLAGNTGHSVALVWEADFGSHRNEVINLDRLDRSAPSMNAYLVGKHFHFPLGYEYKIVPELGRDVVNNLLADGGTAVQVDKLSARDIVFYSNRGMDLITLPA